MPSITFRVAPSLHKRLLEHCESNDIQLSDVMRRAVEIIVDGLDERVEEFRSPQAASIPSAMLQPVKRLTPGIRGFALDGTPIAGGIASRQKVGKK